MPVDRVEMAALARTQLTDTVALATMDMRAPTVELVGRYNTVFLQDNYVNGIVNQIKRETNA